MISSDVVVAIRREFDAVDKEGEDWSAFPTNPVVAIPEQEGEKDEIGYEIERAYSAERVT